MAKKPARKRPVRPTKPTASVADQVEQEQIVAALKKRQAGKKLSRTDIAAIRRYEQRREDELRDQTLCRIPQHVLCELVGSDRKMIRAWEVDGMPFAMEGRQKFYDLRLVLPWLKKRWLGGESVLGEMSKRSAEIKLLIRREAALQLKMQIMSGQLRDSHEVEAENAQKVIAVRAGIEALRRALAPAVLELGDDATIENAETLIWDYVEPLLNTFATAKRDKP